MLCSSNFADHNSSSRLGLPVVQSLKADKGLALQDLVLGAYDFVGTLDLSPEARVYLVDQLASTECVVRSSQPSSLLLTPSVQWFLASLRHRLSLGGNEKIQLTGLLGGFKVAMEINAKKANAMQE